VIGKHSISLRLNGLAKWILGKAGDVGLLELNLATSAPDLAAFGSFCGSRHADLWT
jgi:hypothetical protein